MDCCERESGSARAVGKRPRRRVRARGRRERCMVAAVLSRGCGGGEVNGDDSVAAGAID